MTSGPLSDGVVSLRHLTRDDAPFIAEAAVDPLIRRYSLPHDRDGRAITTPSIADVEATIDEFGANWITFERTGKPSGVAFAVTDATSGELLGMCGVDEWSSEDVAQIGYWLAPHARGRGGATRAVVLLTRWLFDLGAARVFLTIVAGNDASVAVARRAGFEHEGTMRAHAVWDGARCDVLWFAALPGEWPVRVADGSVFSCSDLEELSRVVSDVWLAAADRDWSVPAGTLEWSCAATADHAVDCVLAPALFLASGKIDGYPAFEPITLGPTPSAATLVEGLVAATRILTAVVRTAGRGDRAAIWRRPDVEVRGPGDFVPRAALELILHAHDIAEGLGVVFEPSGDLCHRLRDHTRSWPMWDLPGWSRPGTSGDPWADLLRCAGRSGR